jgi:hypothetical protein
MYFLLFTIFVLQCLQVHAKENEDIKSLLEGITKRRGVIQTACFEYKYGTFWTKPLKSLPFDWSDQEIKKNLFINSFEEEYPKYMILK